MEKGDRARLLRHSRCGLRLFACYKCGKMEFSSAWDGGFTTVLRDGIAARSPRSLENGRCRIYDSRFEEEISEIPDASSRRSSMCARIGRVRERERETRRVNEKSRARARTRPFAPRAANSNGAARETTAKRRMIYLHSSVLRSRKVPRVIIAGADCVSD